MPAKKLPSVAVDETYLHIYNKGVNGRVIFRDTADYEVFLSFLKEYLLATGDLESKKRAFTVNGRVFRGTPHQPKNYFGQVELVFYVLSSDHFHLLLHQRKAGSIARFMRSLATRYSMYFNKKYKQSGALFDRSYKAAEVLERAQQLHLTAYLYKTHEKSSYSSYADFIGKTHTLWLSRGEIDSITQSTSNYKRFAENYARGVENTHLLKDITLGISEEKKLERIIRKENLSSSVQEPKVIDAQLPHASRLPEYLVTSVIFITLLSISIFKVNTTIASNRMPHVLSATVTPSNEPLVSPVVEIASSSAHPVLQTPEPTFVEPEIASESAEVHPTVIIQAVEGATVIIRSKPSVDSGKIGEARNNDSFVFISQTEGWFEIKLSDGSTGYVSAKYSYLQ